MPYSLDSAAGFALPTAHPTALTRHAGGCILRQRPAGQAESSSASAADSEVAGSSCFPLVAGGHYPRLLAELFRLRRGGRSRTWITVSPLPKRKLGVQMQRRGH